MSFVSRNSLTTKLIANKKYRDAYVLEHVKNGIPSQIRALREQREWKQSELGERAGKQQHGIARLEDPRIGHKLSIKTLLELASAFDVALLVKFVPFSRLVKEYEDVSPDALSAESVSDEEEVKRLEEWATEEEVEPIAARAGEDQRNELPASPFRVFEGKGNATPVQPRLRFMHEVARQSGPPLETFFGKQLRTKDTKEAESPEQPITLAMVASGGGRR